MAEDSDSEIVLSPKLESLSEEYAKDPTSRKFYPLAEEYRKSGMMEEAIYICKEGLKNHPNYMPALMTLAHCYVETKNYTEGLPLLQEILERGPENAVAHRLAGDLYFSQGEIDRAKEHYLGAQKLLPDDRITTERLQMIGFPEKDLMSDRAIDVSETTEDQEVEFTEKGEPIEATTATQAARESPGEGLGEGRFGDDEELELDLDQEDELDDVVLTLGDEGESVDLFVPTQKRVAAVEEPDEPKPLDVESEETVFAPEGEQPDITPPEEAKEKDEEQFKVGEPIEVGEGAAAAYPESKLKDEGEGEPLIPGDEVEPLEIPPVETEAIVAEDEETALVQELDGLSPEELQEIPLEELVLREGDIVERGMAPAAEVEAKEVADSALEIEAEEEMPEAPLEPSVEAELMEQPAVMVEPFIVEQVEIGDLDVEEPVAAAPEEPVQEEELPAPPTITSARIYEEQGHLTEALEIYRWLSERDPDYKYLESKVVELENRLEREKEISVNGAQQHRLETLRRWLSNIEAFKGERNIEDA